MTSEERNGGAERRTLRCETYWSVKERINAKLSRVSNSWQSQVTPSIGIRLVLALIGREWICMLVLITGNSMLPTLHTGQILVVNKLAYARQQPRRGDIGKGLDPQKIESSNVS